MTVFEKLHERLIELKKTLAIAESCSGGHLTAKFVSMQGASKYLLGGLVTYSNHMKIKVLGVSEETILQEGAVSRSIAHEMWLGLMKVSGADFGIATTGIAGPSGGTKEKPVGIVFIAVGKKGEKPHVEECHFDGNRASIIEATCQESLNILGSMLT